MSVSTKNILTILFSILLTLFQRNSFAQTIIDTSIVSGSWTFSGSPYIVQVSTMVPTGQTLTISPGVVVQFLPDKILEVQGHLIADGTASLPITFEANDTMGWADSTSALGGWGGLFFHAYYEIAPDISTFNYCIVKDVKATLSFTAVGLTCSRPLKILNSDFYHNRIETCISITTLETADTVEINSCVIKNNFGQSAGIIRNSNYWGGHTKILNSQMMYNHNTSIVWGNVNDILIENNLIHHNDQMLDVDGAIALNGGSATIRGNKIYFNQCGSQAGLACNNCIALIENNLICNNTNYAPACGLTGGGGGVYISGDFNHSVLGGTYVVRNNIIANNYYESNAGGGLFIFFADAIVSNNDFVNNNVGTVYHGKGISIWGGISGVASKVHMKNNLFYSKSPSGIVDTSHIIFIATASEILLENNFLPSPLYKSVDFQSGLTPLIGDTLTNTFGILPGMVSPTADNSFLTDATIANFDLLSASLCINQGDTATCFPAAIDYAGSNRISDGIIDIGAYEFQHAAGILAQRKPSTFYVYPNPTDNYFTVTNEPQYQSGELTISDCTGQIIYKSFLTEDPKTVVNSTDFKAGLYFIQIQTQDFIQVEKIVVAK